MKQRLLHGVSSRVAVSVVAALAVAALVPTFAGGIYGDSETPASISASPASTVFMKADKKGIRFVAPKTIVAGEDLEVLNQSNPKQVGPHTFSLVTKGSLPKTPKARQACFTKGHICKAIALWHGAKGNGPPTKNPVLAGVEGWDTEGNLSKAGDSWYTGSKPGTSIVEKVTAAPGTDLYFLCAVHPFMQGKIKVLAPAG